MLPGPSELTPLLAEADQATTDNEDRWWMHSEQEPADTTASPAGGETAAPVPAEAAEEAPYSPTRGTLEKR